MLYAGFCAEVAFGLDPREAQRYSNDDLRKAHELFPGHHPEAELTKVLSLVNHYKGVIDRASVELLNKGSLDKSDLLRLMEDA